MPFPSPFFQRCVLGDHKMPKHHGQARAAYAVGERGHFIYAPQPNLPPLIDNLPGRPPGALQKTCPPVSAFGRAFFAFRWLADGVLQFLF